MSSRPEQPEPFLRGCVFPAVTDAPYPRADPAGAEYLPADVWDAAQLPVGVRLELAGNARTIRVWYRTTRASLGYRGESAGCSFVAYRGGQKVAAVEAVMGEGMAELVVSGRTDLPVTVYLPEGMQPLITGVAGVEATMVPAPPQPRWLAYGDAVTQGWLASAPAMAWPAVAGRKLGLDVCNLGYAGTARGESTSAVLLAETPAEVISIAFGLNNWSRVPHTAGLMSEEVRCFLAIVRKGHPDVPIVVVSPTARPDAEDSPNRVGATLAEIRLAMEEAVLDWIGEGDKKVYLVEGLSVVDPEDLEDGIYPGDEGHRRLAAAVAKVLVPHLSELQEAARIRWTREHLPVTAVATATAAPVSTPVEIPTTETGHVGAASLDVGFVADVPVAAEVVDEMSFDDAAGSGHWWLNQPAPLTGDVFDPTPPAGSPLELDSLEDDPAPVAPRNLDLPDLGSLGRESLNDALLDALSSNGSAPSGPTPSGPAPSGPAPSGPVVDAAPVDDALADDSFVDDLSAGDLSAGDPYTDETYAAETYADQTYAADPYTDDPYSDETYAAETYADQTYGAEMFNAEAYGDETFVDSFVDDPPFDASPVDASPVDASAVDDLRPVDDSSAEFSFVAQSFLVDDGPLADVAAAVPPVASALDDLPLPPVVVPTLEETLAQAAAAVPADPDQITAVADDAAPVAVPPLPASGFSAPGFSAPGFDDPYLDADSTAPPSVNPAAPPSPVAVPSPTSAPNGEVPVSPAMNGTAVASAEAGAAPAADGTAPVRTPPPAVRRDTGHVDIAVADMVVAALTLATNGADDVIYGHEPAPTDELQWAEAADPGSF